MHPMAAAEVAGHGARYRGEHVFVTSIRGRSGLRDPPAPYLLLGMLPIPLRKGLVAALMLSGAAGGCFGDDDRSSPPEDDAVFRSLETRPLELPTVNLHGRSVREYGGSGRCVEGEETAVGSLILPVAELAALGPPGEAELKRGPVYPVLEESAPRIAALFNQPKIGQSKAVGTIWLSRPTYDGPVLIRGGRLDRPGELGFGSRAEPRIELRLPAGDWPLGGVGASARRQAMREGWRATSVPTRIRAPGCYAFQVDGVGFSYVLAFGAQAYGGTAR
jgi:hypothetical protein